MEWKLVGVDDYLNNQSIKDTHYVVVNLGALYLMFNRRDGVNSEVYTDGDTVTIIEQADFFTGSWNLANLTETSAFTTPDGTYAIKVCEHVLDGTPDFARVVVALNDGTDPCLITPSPSSLPSLNPSEAPSTKPSLVPSSVPSSDPSEVPSTKPSFVPSDLPTSERTGAPTSV